MGGEVEQTFLAAPVGLAVSVFAGASTISGGRLVESGQAVEARTEGDVSHCRGPACEGGAAL